MSTINVTNLAGLSNTGTAATLSSINGGPIAGEKDAVDDEGKPVYQGIDQSKLVPLLTAALQEAITRIETLEAEVTALKGGTN